MHISLSNATNNSSFLIFTKWNLTILSLEQGGKYHILPSGIYIYTLALYSQAHMVCKFLIVKVNFSLCVCAHVYQVASHLHTTINQMLEKKWCSDPFCKSNCSTYRNMEYLCSISWWSRLLFCESAQCCRYEGLTAILSDSRKQKFPNGSRSGLEKLVCIQDENGVKHFIFLPYRKGMPRLLFNFPKNLWS